MIFLLLFIGLIMFPWSTTSGFKQGKSKMLAITSDVEEE